MNVLSSLAQLDERSELPRRTLRAGTQLYRIHRKVHGPWFYDGSGAGRFDPVGSESRGACYWAERPLGAWIEVFRTRLLIPESEISGRVLSCVELVDPVVVADLTSRRALRFGITAATTSGHDYSESQAIADHLQGRRAGVRWGLRHDLRQALIGVAVFGPDNDNRAPDGWGEPEAESLPEDLIESAGRLFGYEILPDPPH